MRTSRVGDILSNMITQFKIALSASAALFALSILPVAPAQSGKPAPPKSLRLYVLDCGKITVANGDSMGFKPAELATSNMVTPCFLIVHPRGTLMWDTGEIPDSGFASGVSPQTQGAFTVDRPLLPQLAAIGYKPSDITYLWLCRTTMTITSQMPTRSQAQPGSASKATATPSSPRGPTINRKRPGR